MVKEIRGIYLVPKDGMVVDNRGKCMRMWMSKRFKWFIVIDDHTDSFELYQRISKEDFDSIPNNENIFVSVQGPNVTHIVEGIELYRKKMLDNQ